MTSGSGARDSIFHSRTGPGAAKPGPADRLFMLAEAHRNAGRLGRMRTLLRSYLRLKPARPEAAVALALTGRYGEALEMSASLLRPGSLTPEEISFLGNPWLNIRERGFIERSIAACVNFPARGLAARLKALHLFILRSTAGRPAGRPPAFRGALSIMNVHAARALLEAPRPRAAAGLLAETIRNYPLDELTAGTLAEALLASGRESRALSLMGKLAPVMRSPGFHAWRGQLLLTCGRYREAAAVLSSPPASLSPMSGCWLGAALLKLGRTTEAAAALRRALRKDPADNEARLWLAEALRLSVDIPAARKAAAAALRSEPANPWAQLTSACLSPEVSAPLLIEFMKGPGKLLRPPRTPGTGWACAILRASDTRRPEPHFLLAGAAAARLVPGCD